MTRSLAITGSNAGLTGDEDTVAFDSEGPTFASDPGAAPGPGDPLDPLGSLRALGDARSMRLALGSPLGRGGMGLVREGTQLAMGRSVAVKTVRPELLSEGMTLRLLQEAWITGALEHPNVIPIYDVGVDASGAPLIAMKRVDGVSWDALMRDADQVRARFGDADLLDWNVQTLMTVCNAVAFAHSRGILHRDLKPENVLVCDYGQVYVADWGIAVSLREDADGRFPLASRQAGIAGTPSYLAPEMLEGDGARLSERTDVYLLGGILCEILTGAPPHRGVDRSAPPELPSDAPADLVAICRRAMALRPEDRFESAEAFRAALQLYLVRRDSRRLTAEAEAHLEALTSAGASASAREVHDRFGACRFGFQEALRSWPGNARARCGLHEAIEHMVERELARDEPGAASSMLAQHDAPPPELVARVEAAARARADRERRMGDLERLGRDHDASIAAPARSAVSISLCLGVTLTPLVVHVLDGGPSDAMYPHLVGGLASLVGLVGVVAYAARRRLAETVVNRRAVALSGLALAAQLGLFGTAWALAIPFASACALSLVVWFVVAGAAALAIDARLAPIAVGVAAALALTVASPGSALLATAGAGLVGTLNIAWLRRDVWVGALPSRSPAPL